jgi:ring-1,2-phenylacetyl-CoA epoxidase subunit PaaC
MDTYDAYQAITDVTDDQRWAFGTGFDDPLSGVDTTVPDGVSGTDLGTYCEMLGDDALIMSHRLQQWVAHAPELEEEAALANVALDLLGQARLLLARAGAADGSGRTEDDYAFRRGPAQFRNVRLVELVDADFGVAMARLFVLSTWRLALLDRLRTSRDPVLGAVAEKGVKELTYHRDYAARWVIRLGDGTGFSHQRVQAALDQIAPFVGELFVGADVETRLAAAGVAVDPSETRGEFDAVIDEVLSTATLRCPAWPEPAGAGRTIGRGDTLTRLLAELQSVARAHPGATW